MRKAVVDEKLVVDLARIGCNNIEISSLAGISVDTLNLRYQKLIDKGRATLKHSLRRKQIELALKGNITLLIFLGKVYLGQQDTQYIEQKNKNNNNNNNVNINRFESVDELKARLEKVLNSENKNEV